MSTKEASSCTILALAAFNSVWRNSTLASASEVGQGSFCFFLPPAFNDACGGFEADDEGIGETPGGGAFDAEAESKQEPIAPEFKIVVVALPAVWEALPGTKVIVVLRPGIPEDDKVGAEIEEDGEDAAESGTKSAVGKVKVVELLMSLWVLLEWQDLM